MTDSSSPAIVFTVTAVAVFEMLATACSSPQTAEINATTRAATLMKWVYIGLGLGAALTITEIAILHSSGRPTWPAALGGGSSIAVLWALYAHAKHAGLASTQPGTEQW